MVKYSNFKQWMVANKVKQKDIAKLLDISETSLSLKMNSSETDFTLTQVRKLCDEYNLSGDLFFLNKKLTD